MKNLKELIDITKLGNLFLNNKFMIIFIFNTFSTFLFIYYERTVNEEIMGLKIHSLHYYCY